ncbi:MAG: DUF3892 domain-containing protein [Gemmatimonadota bacterium]|nr:DUF3892 domain-containing protein [Gemmatimonadota bacterium]
MGIRITCINKDAGHHENPYVAINHLNWVNDRTNESGRSTRLAMYDFVKGGGEAYVQTATARAALIPEVSPRGTKYVRTRPDHTRTDNLLSLPECR